MTKETENNSRLLKFERQIDRELPGSPLKNPPWSFSSSTQRTGSFPGSFRSIFQMKFLEKIAENPFNTFLKAF